MIDIDLFRLFKTAPEAETDTDGETAPADPGTAEE